MTAESLPQRPKTTKTARSAPRKDYFDARHHCYAFILGPDGAHYRTNDGGEPTHSAGDPILGQIRSRQLANVLVVVVRYFGGTKLGLGGLVQAYRAAAASALDTATIIQQVVKLSLQLLFGYEHINAVMKIIKDYELEVTSQDFTDQCRMTIWVRKSRVLEVEHLFQQAGATVTS